LPLAFASAGRSNPANMAMMAMTTSSSMSVKALGRKELQQKRLLYFLMQQI
jgi:hypothetical protein